MTKTVRRRNTRWLLPLSLGLSDGILNALILASSAVLGDNGGMTMGLAARVSTVALVTAMFTVFVAEYAQLRSELSRAEHELNLTAAGRLATGRLGHAVRLEAIQATAVASACSFLGSLTPLLIGAVLPTLPWVSLVAAVAALGVLGLLLARAVSGDPLRWAVVMTIGGAIVAFVGVQLDLT
jgi:hypothetical protein